MAGCLAASLLSFAGLVGAAVVVPATLGLAVVAVLLGGVGLASSSSWGGPGTGAARGAVLIGLASGVLQGALVAGVAIPASAAASELRPAVAGALRLTATGDAALAADRLAEPVRASNGADRLRWFLVALEGEIGAYQRTEFSWWSTPMASRRRLRELALAGSATGRGSAGVGGGAVGGPDVTPWPLTIVGDRGSTIVWAILDERALRDDRVRIAGLMAAPAEAGSAYVITLLPEAGFAELARSWGLGVRSWAGDGEGREPEPGDDAAG